MRQRTRSAKKWEHQKISEIGLKASFLLPTMIILGFLSLYPFGYAIFLSLHDWNLARPHWGMQFVGIENFVNALTSPRFLNSVQSTFIILGGALALQFSLGLGIALLLNVDIKGMRITRGVILLPCILTPIIVGLLWNLLYRYDYGLINYLLTLFGLSKIHWLTSEWPSRIGIMLADTWQWTAFTALILFAGIRSIPEALSESASIDGASKWQQFRYVTLPLIKPAILVAILIRTIDAFRMFEKIFAITRGGPGGATETLSYLIYLEGFDRFEMGVASSYSLLFLVIVIAVVQIIFQGSGAKKLFFEEKAT